MLEPHTEEIICRKGKKNRSACKTFFLFLLFLFSHKKSDASNLHKNYLWGWHGNSLVHFPHKKKRQNALSSIDNKTIAANFPCGQWGTECITNSQVGRQKMNFECAWTNKKLMVSAPVWHSWTEARKHLVRSVREDTAEALMQALGCCEMAELWYF